MATQPALLGPHCGALQQLLVRQLEPRLAANILHIHQHCCATLGRIGEPRVNTRPLSGCAHAHGTGAACAW